MAVVTIQCLVTVVTPEFLVAVVTIMIVLGDCDDTRVLGGWGDYNYSAW